MVIHADFWLRMYSTTAHMAAIPIHINPSALRGDIPLESRPAGIASTQAALIPGFQSMELASLAASGKLSD